MSRIHFLNVGDGDCTWIQHDSGRNSVIDICGGNRQSMTEIYESSSYGNHNQKNHPINSVDYMSNHGLKDIARFILTHPDMDHMDGIKKLFKMFRVQNMWDTDNNKKIDSDAYWGSYNQDDWNFYQRIRRSSSNPSVLRLNDGDEGKDYTDDGITILAPSPSLVQLANDTEEYNNISYVLLLQEHGRKIVFGGDSEQASWDYILRNYEDEVTDVDVLFAPHHGRKSGGNDEYLDVLNPKITFFGNAGSKDLDYSSWNRRGLKHYTNNEGGSYILDIDDNGVFVFCTYEPFARQIQDSDTWPYRELDAWFLDSL